VKDSANVLRLESSKEHKEVKSVKRLQNEKDQQTKHQMGKAIKTIYQEKNNRDEHQLSRLFFVV
jgi:hypothetical protein